MLYKQSKMVIWMTSYPVAAVLLVASLFLVSGLAYSEPVIQCQVPLNVQCSIAETNGIQRVVVKLETGLGVVEAVDNTYTGCPTQVGISWDPIVPDSEIIVTPCTDPGIGTIASFPNTDGTPFINRDFNLRAYDRDGDGKLDVARVLPASLSRIQVEKPQTPLGTTLWCNSISACEIVADICDANGGAGQCFKDHCECTLP